MQGPQHRSFAIPFGILFATSLILILGFGLEYVLTIPLCYYFAVFPDIDQATYSPKDTRRIKALWETLMWLIPLAAAGVLAYFCYRYFHDNYTHFKPMELKHIGFSLGVIIVGLLLNIYKKSKFGKFLWGHRGFTHTLAVPILLVILYNQLRQMSDSVEIQYLILIRAASVLVAGLFAGIVCHIFLDMTCAAGAPILWPISNIRVHIGNAVTSDPKHPGKPHKSSIITTKFWSIVCIVLTFVVLFFYKDNFMNLFPFK